MGLLIKQEIKFFKKIRNGEKYLLIYITYKLKYVENLNVYK